MDQNNHAIVMASSQCLTDAHRAPADPALHLLQALPIAAALYQEDGQLLTTNAVFQATFPHWRHTHHWSDLLTGFDLDNPPAPGASMAALHSEGFCRQTQRTYQLDSTDLTLSDGTQATLLTVLSLHQHVESLQRQQQLHAQLLQTSRALSVGEMATTIAHELNQPLSSIINYLSSAQRQLHKLDAAPARLQDALRLAQAQAAQAAGVISRIREFVQQREPRREPCALPELIDHVCELLQHEARQHRARISVELAAALPAVQIDKVMITQVLTNLIRNALDAMLATPPKERLIRILANLDVERRVRVQVLDRGAGIAPADAPHLFTAFFTTKPNGMGAGLAICRSIIEFHDGSLYCEANPAGGANFIFTLPTERP